MAATHESELHRRIREKRALVGCVVDSGSPAVAELAAMLGFDIVWLDMEHGQSGWRDAMSFCHAVQAGGAMPMVRIPGAERNYVLHALDLGAPMVVVPMVNTPAIARQIVQHGKYRPVGDRGYVGSGRGLRFGVGDPLTNIARANAETHLFAQIETVEAVKNCAEIMSIDGIGGGLVGPADLSFSMDRPLAFEDKQFTDVYAGAIRQIRAAGKIAATAVAHPGLISAALEAGVQILISAAELGALRTQWSQTIKDLTARIRG